DIHTVARVDGAFNLTVNTSGLTWFEGSVGDVTTLVDVTTNAAGSTRIGSEKFATTGAVTFNDAVTLNGPFNSTRLPHLGGAFHFNSTLDGPDGATIGGGGTVTFAGTVGATSPLFNLVLNSPTALNGGFVTTSGAQTYNNPVTLSADTTLTSTGSVNLSLA